MSLRSALEKTIPPPEVGKVTKQDVKAKPEIDEPPPNYEHVDEAVKQFEVTKKPAAKTTPTSSLSSKFIDPEKLLEEMFDDLSKKMH